MDTIKGAISCTKSDAFRADSMTLFMLKLSLLVTLSYITHIINLSLERRYFPKSLKQIITLDFFTIGYSGKKILSKK